MSHLSTIIFALTAPVVARIIASMKPDELKTRLVRFRGRIPLLADRAGVSRRTIERILYVDGYLPRLRTYLAIVDAIRGMR